MKFTIQLNEDDFVGLLWLNVRPRPFFKILGWILLSVFAAASAVGIYSTLRTGSIGDLARSVGVIAAIPILLLLVLSRGFKRLFRRKPELQRPFEIEFTPWHITYVLPTRTVTLDWTDVTQWKRGRKLIAIFHKNGTWDLIPERAFKSQAERTKLEGLLQTAIGAAAP